MTDKEKFIALKGYLAGILGGGNYAVLGSADLKKFLLSLDNISEK